MQDFNELLRGFRLRRLTDDHTMFDRVESDTNPLADLDTELADGPATQEYQEHLREGLPDPSKMGVGPVRGILAALAGGLAGFGENSAVAGATLGRSIIDAPYNHALRNYTQKAKSLGTMAEIEAENRRNRRLERRADLDREERRRAEEERAKDRDLTREMLQNRPQRGYKPEILKDNLGVATGEMLIYGPNGPEKVEIPGLKGVRTNAESPTVTQKRISSQDVLARGQAALKLFQELKAEGLPIIGTPHVGPGQGAVSKALTDTGMIDDPRVRDLHQFTDEIANMQLYAMSGAQINNKEYERLRRTLASTNRAEASYETDLKRFLRFHEAASKGWISENDVNWTPESDPRMGGTTPSEFPTGTPSSSRRRWEVEPVR